MPVWFSCPIVFALSPDVSESLPFAERFELWQDYVFQHWLEGRDTR